jgi:malonate transporter
MATTVYALLPVFLLIAIGWLLQYYDFPGRGFWQPAERITYFILLPALLVKELAGADLVGLSPVPLAIALLLATVILSAGLIAARPWLGVDGPAFTSIFQGAIRFNTYVGLAGALTLAGDRGVAIFALVSAIGVPLVNIASVVVLARYADDQPRSLRQQLSLIGQNPLILACIAGIVLNIGDLELPPGIAPALDMLGKASVALGLLTVGAALNSTHVRVGGTNLALTAALKLVVYPLLVGLICWLFHIVEPTREVLVLWAALPISSSAYILARQLGGDAGLMAGAITVTTILAAVTLPFILAIAG